MRIVNLCLLLLVLIMGGCVSVRVENLPVEVDRSSPKSADIPIYSSGGVRPPHAGIPFARLVASAGDVVSFDRLKSAMASEAARAGADWIEVTAAGAVANGSATSYGGGLAINQPIYSNVAYGFAFVRAPVRLGMGWDDKYVVTDVIPGSAADKAGAHIGDRILAFGPSRVSGDLFAVYRCAAKAKPGDVVDVEFVDRDGHQRVSKITYDAN